MPQGAMRYLLTVEADNEDASHGHMEALVQSTSSVKHKEDDEDAENEGEDEEDIKKDKEGKSDEDNDQDESDTTKTADANDQKKDKQAKQDHSAGYTYPQQIKLLVPRKTIVPLKNKHSTFHTERPSQEKGNALAWTTKTHRTRPQGIHTHTRDYINHNNYSIHN
jgi:hypothetical protein